MRIVLIFLGLLLPGRALAHTSEGAFVLLLPTGHYIAGGVATVAVTVLLMALLPARRAEAIFRPVPLHRVGRRGRRPWPSLLSLLVLLCALWMGRTGSQDPTINALPLLVWTGFWLFLVSLQAVVGDIWRVLNPWTGLWALAGRRAWLNYPRGLGRWPGLVSLMAFAAFLLADIAPAAPERLALAAGGYWAFHMAGTLIFGLRWLLSAEALTILMRAYAGLAPVGRRRGRRSLGLPGWRWMARPAPPMALAVVMIALLGIGSFDGINETFWWLARIGMNPLEFTGRSAVTIQTLTGLFLSVGLLVAVFAATLQTGMILAEGEEGGAGRGGLAHAFRVFAPTILPIAIAYHVAHYLTAMLVEGQYLALYLNDPFRQGWHLLGIEARHVTTGFFNTRATVQVIFLAQAGTVVLGHVLAILMAHVLALRLYGDGRRALLSQLPLAAFMIAYTLFGLWLLASPRGA
ncbi:hypothetical protein [Oceanicola sp. 22II-s10i]|uniref:hypothetical protein n=1 Tax=Oceanicola sp. 22II-s10i TaxID=1317116 RepID=UPI000B525B42|nr:hypothetical protein [Oceanicola sp. 22II-s10i]